MARKRSNNAFSAKHANVAAKSDSFLLGNLENILHNFFRKSPDEAKANLNSAEWLIYLGILLTILVMPFLYSRATTENFLTPKEFFSKMAFALLGGIFCVRLFLGRKIELAKTRLDFPLALFFGFAVFSVLYNYNIPSAIRDLRGALAIVLLYPLMANVVRSRWQVELILWVVIFTGMATSFIGFLETYNLYFKFDTQNLIQFVREDVLQGKIDPSGYYLPLFPQLANREAAMASVVSTFGNRNYLGTFAMFTAFLPLAFIFYYKKLYMKIISVMLFGGMLYGLYITRCRAALIGIALGIVYMFLIIFLNDRRYVLMKKYAYLSIGSIAILFFGLFFVSVKTIQSESIWDKIQYTMTLDRKVSNTYERMWVWYATIESFNKTPSGWLFGNGFGSFKHFFPYQEAETFSDENQETFTPVTFRQAHNDWLQLISEMGLIGLGLFLFLVFRFFNSIQQALRREVFGRKDGELTGDHVLLISISAAIVAQLLASIPDFPFHRIETAVYAVLFMGLVPVLTETSFFTKPIQRKVLPVNGVVALIFAVLSASAAIGTVYYEHRCWKADEMVRSADMYMRYTQPEAQNMAKSLLAQATELDPLPGDPYLKLATIYQKEQDAEKALYYADKALTNINFNARSTYHSAIFRKMHIYYHLMNKLPEAFQMATTGLSLTAGDARSIYYMYGGKIALDISRYNLPEPKRVEMLEQAESYLAKATRFPSFEMQARASLAVVQASRQKWVEAYANAASVSASVSDRDPTILNIMGIAASNLGNHAAAEGALQKALELQPGNIVYKRDLGIVYVRLNRFDKARPYLEDVALAPSSPPDMKQHANSLIASITEAEVKMAGSMMGAGKEDQAMMLLKNLHQARVVPENVRRWAEDNMVKLNRLPAEQPDEGVSFPATGQATSAVPVYQMPVNPQY